MTTKNLSKFSIPFFLVALLLFVSQIQAQSNLAYGPRAKSMAGAGTAIVENSIWGNSNPGGQVFLGQKLGIGIEIAMPKASYFVAGEPTEFEQTQSSIWPLGIKTGGVDSENKVLVIPQIGFNMSLDDNNSIGISIYGNGNKGKEYAAKTYYSPVIADFGSSEGFINPMGTVSYPTFMKLNQYFAALSYSRKFGDKLGIGISLVGAWQSFSAGGLEAFGSLHYSEFPNELTNNETANSFGVGGKLGVQWNVSKKFQAGVAFRTKLYMTTMDEYKGLISESGKLDIPSEWSIGLVYHPFDRFLMALDMNRICHSGVPAWGLAMKQKGAVSLGGENGGGFGRTDQMTYKFGIQYSIPKWQFRVGYQYSDLTLIASEFLLNMMMPDVITDHVSFGFSRDIGEQNISFAIVKGFKKTATGFNVMDNAQFMDLTAQNLLFEVAVEF
ncbi:hypothetical protein HNS38_04885 [Lentimicrobium sp. L6]|uniref:OmpP1/FadL family transporter n=1 Tax=Lentimicrobium sp. L6 TaxID=2735916 RepID=UPI00155752E3|nr:outer membrane protein transport protein [Lentimicrobium sp. L6]NPD84081.1 hypothetical protein [Lentimicrobium sp. L6]